MRRRTVLRSPPATPRAQRLQREIIGQLVPRALFAYVLFALVLVIAARMGFAAFAAHSWLPLTATGVGLLLAYLAIGGALFGLFIGPLRGWPPPPRDLRLNGAHFTHTWLWSAPRLLSDLSNSHVRHRTA